MFLHESLLANGGAGSPITLGRIVCGKAIFDFITNDSLASIVVNDGGDGYVVGETFDIVLAVSPGEVTEIFTARGVVTAIGSTSPSASPDGSVTRCKLLSGGSYRSLDGSPHPPITGVATANASAAGDDTMTVDVVIEPAHWTEDRGDGIRSPIPSTDFVDDNTDFEWIATSTKATNPATIGIQTNQSGGNGALQLLVSTGFDNSQTFYSQPDASPGGHIMTPGTDPEIYISSSERRVNIMIRDGNFVQYGVIGFFIPFTDTEANYPFPGIKCGQSVGFRPFTQTYLSGNGSSADSDNAGFIHPMTIQTASVGNCPYHIRNNVSPTWLPLNELSNTDTARPIQMWPFRSDGAHADLTHAPEIDGFDTDPQTGFQFSGILSDDSGDWFSTDAGGAQGVPGIGALGLNNRLSFVVQPHLIQNLPGDVQVIGLVDGFEAVHGIGLTAFEEVVQHGGNRYIVFPDTNGPDNFQWVAMEII